MGEFKQDKPASLAVGYLIGTKAKSELLRSPFSSNLIVPVAPLVTRKSGDFKCSRILILVGVFSFSRAFVRARVAS
ncbi:MAG: hypothetical protein GPJ22_23005 [Microcystis aeruginosa LL13-03]|nr:hypothetical protein [Microcystis aeruginosa LL13-03]